MKKTFVIKGGNILRGEVKISGHKNAAGPILAATLLSEKPSTIDNLPLIDDILNLVEILKKMGAKIEWLGRTKIKISPAKINPNKIPADLFEKMRVSVLLVGPLLARFKAIKIPRPGGDQIGVRPIYTHLEALSSFGVSVKEREGFYILKAPKKLTGKNIVLKEFSVSCSRRSQINNKNGG
jgi:UDP-N-acetylglucosamine 1-carboxyvinyltransferase